MGIDSGALADPLVLAAMSENVVLRLRLIGQMEAWTLNSESVLPAGRKTRALLAIVALSAPRPVLRSRLAEMLWSRRPDEQARASLRQEIHRLLDSLSPVGAEVLSVTRDHLALRPGMVWIDVEEVLRATTRHPAALALLDRELLEELEGVDSGFGTWLMGERERLRDRARGLAEELLREQAEPEAVIPAAQRLLTIDRAHEGAWRALMRAYAARGEHGMAIQAYERCRLALADLLDAVPSPETQKLMGEIRTGRPSEPPPAPPPPLVTVPEPRTSGARGGAKLGVMPLRSVNDGNDAAYFATGLAEELTAALARFRWMFLVSSGSLARLAAATRDEAEIRRAFGLDFLLDGMVQRSADRVRVSLRLLDLREEGSHIVWTQRFDSEGRDLLAMQDEIAAQVVAQIDPEILLIEARRVTAHPPPDPTAYDLVLRALPLTDRLDHESFMQAAGLLQQAIALEPDYAAAHAWYAYWHIFQVGQNWAGDPAAALERAGRLAERAVTLDPKDARGLTIAGHVRAFLHHRLQEGLALHDRALALNPNLAMAWAFSGMTLSYIGDLDEAERRFERYKRLSPMDPHAFFFDAGHITIKLLRRDYEEAVAIGRQVSELNPLFSAGLKHYLSALGHLGLKDEAGSTLARLLAIEPGFTVRHFLKRTPFANPDDRDHYAEGLRRAGVPEG